MAANLVLTTKSKCECVLESVRLNHSQSALSVRIKSEVHSSCNCIAWLSRSYSLNVQHGNILIKENLLKTILRTSFVNCPWLTEFCYVWFVIYTISSFLSTLPACSSSLKSYNTLPHNQSLFIILHLPFVCDSFNFKPGILSVEPHFWLNYLTICRESIKSH